MKIIIPDISNPETVAMLQALYSRSDTSVEEHLKDLHSDDTAINEKEQKLQKKMQKFYIGYGHDSIGDCGSTTVFIEGVSIIAAKAIQDTPLYSGQESSTRYLDFSNQSEKVKDNLKENYPQFYEIDPEKIDAMVDEYFVLYKEITHTMQHHKAAILGMNLNAVDPVVRRSINAWAFDVARGFLPAGTITQLSFHGSLRELRRHFMELKNHAVDEVSHIAINVLKKLHEKYPSSFKDTDYLLGYLQTNSMEESYPAEIISMEESYHALLGYPLMQNHSPVIWSACSTTAAVFDGSEKRRSTIKDGVIGIHSTPLLTLDYGSWRDLQRHRNGICEATIPQLLTIYNSERRTDNPLMIHDWYLKNTNTYPNLQIAINEFHSKLYSWFGRLLSMCEESEEQDRIHSFISYLLPLGCLVPVSVFYSLEQWDYVFDLRLRDTVHPTLVEFLSKVVYEIGKKVPYFISKYEERIMLLERNQEELSKQRGKQTIILEDGTATSD